MRLMLVLFLALTVGLSVPSQSLAGLFETNIEKARDLAKIEKKYEAKKLLDEAILEDPLDADVHYGAGLVYSQLGMTSDFDLAMKNACKLKSSYCPKVAEPYYTMGFNYLNGGSQRSAIRSFEKAFAYQPAKRAEAINRLLGSGKTLLSNKNGKGAEMYFSVLTHFSPSHKNQVAKLYFDMGQNSSSKEAIEYYRLATRYSNTYKKQIGADLASVAKNNDYSEQERAALKRSAGKYLSKSEVLAYFPPDYKIYQPGTYTFNLKAGETTDHWIRIPNGTRFLPTSSNNKFILKFRDGFEQNAWEAKRVPNNDSDFKFTALSDQVLSLRIR